MTTAASPVPAASPQHKRTPYFPAKLLGFVALLSVALWFVWNYPMRYVMHYNEAAFTDPNVGAANYWRERAWLLAHFAGGMLALLVGPWQFWTGFRARYARLHRWMGRLFLAGVVMG